MRKWIDENTGREIRQLTDLPDRCIVNYYRMRRHLPGGLLLAFGKHEQGNLVAIDPESGEVQLIKGEFSHFLSLRESDGRAWFYKHEPDREVWAVDLPNGTPELVGKLNPDAPGRPMEITCDGKNVILLDDHFDPNYPQHQPTTRDIRAFWLYSYRPRHGAVWSYCLETNTAVKMSELESMCPSHVDTSPTDPGLIKHCCDDIGLFNPRMWLVRVDGSELRDIRPSQPKEWTHHEFWWPDGKHIGYKYLDRRNDTTIHESPWGEYSPMPIHLCISNLHGEQVYKSDPLICYQSHLMVSPDASWVCGEGTDGHSFAYAAPFSMSNTKVNLKPYATIHTPYIPSAAQGVETGFSADNRWLVYNDTIDGKLQVCAVEVGE